MVAASNASTVLTVKGSADADTIRVTHGGGGSITRSTRSTARSATIPRLRCRDTGIKSVLVYGYDGTDTIDTSGFDLPVEVHGGSGADTIYGGKNADRSTAIAATT